MGLAIAVGWLALAAREEEEDLDLLRRSYDLLNEVLIEAGMERHHEPLDVPDDQIFEAEMWGYGGLHAIRRLAAYHACEGRLPPHAIYEDYPEDPMTERLNEDLLRNRKPGGWLSRGVLRRWLSRGERSGRFEHLMLHSDCEGFYLPRDFEHVIFDRAVPQREGVGGMVGSSTRLLDECKELASLIVLPEDIDVEADELWENAENPPADGMPWQVYGVEAFGLARLIRGCELSIRSGSALVFC